MRSNNPSNLFGGQKETYHPFGSFEEPSAFPTRTNSFSLQNPGLEQ